MTLYYLDYKNLHNANKDVAVYIEIAPEISGINQVIVNWD